MSAQNADRLVEQIIERLRSAVGDGTENAGASLPEVLKSPNAAIIADRLTKAAADCARSSEMDLELRLAELALEIRRRVIGPKTLSVAKSLDLIVDARSRMKEFAAALPLCREALQIREGILGKRHLETARDLRRLGELEHAGGDHRAAKSSLVRALAIERGSLGSSDSAIAKTLSVLARVEISLGDFAAAVPHCEEALRISTAELHGQHAELVQVLNSLATACQWCGRNADALSACERAIEIVEANFGAYDGRLIEPLCNLSEAALSLGRHYPAYAAAERALEIATKSCGESDSRTARAAAALGSVMLDIGELSRAQEQFTRTLNILRKLGGLPRETAQTLVNLGLVDAKLDEYQSARLHLEEALALFRREAVAAPIGVVVENLAVVNSRLGERSRAMALHQEALQIERRRLGEASEDVGLNLLAIGRLQCDPSEEVSGFDSLLQGMTILLNGEDPSYLAEGYRALAEILGRRSKTVEIFFEKLAINLVQSLRRGIAGFDAALERAFTGSREDAYRSLGDNLILAGRLPEAQQVIAMIKEHELFQLTRGAAEDGRTQAALTPFEEIWLQRIADIRGKIKASCSLTGRDRGTVSRRDEAKKLRERVMQASAELGRCLQQLCADFLRMESPADERTAAGDPADSIIAGKPAPGVATVHYLLAPQDLRIILTTSDLQRDYHVGLAEGEINHLVYSMHSALQERTEQFLPAAQRLYTLLIAPFGHDLQVQRVDTLALSLDGVLRYLPMAALHDGARYLLEDFALLLTTGATDSSGAPPVATAIHGTGLGTSRAFEGRPPLLGVREELAAVIRTGDGSEGIIPGIVKLDEEFTAAALHAALSSGSAVIHIASHFVFAVAQEAASYLQLGDGARLTLAELSRMSFDGVDLVALSACDTALAGGHHQSGREIEGLGALVRGQGARNVIATLWPVADLTTAALMRAFYQNRYQHGLSLPEALRRAQLSLLRGEIKSDPLPRLRGLIDPDDDPTADRRGAGADHPFFWAPYVLMGDASEPAS
jgi:CHAT domain-containing protein